MQAFDLLPLFAALDLNEIRVFSPGGSFDTVRDASYKLVRYTTHSNTSPSGMIIP